MCIEIKTDQTFIVGQAKVIGQEGTRKMRCKRLTSLTKVNIILQ